MSNTRASIVGSVRNTKMPTGVTLTRSGTKFKATWKEAEKYSKAKYIWGYKRNGKFKWLDSHITTNKKAEVTLSAPIEQVAIQVYGYSSRGWSGAATKYYSIFKPYRPTIKTTFVQTAMTTFEWKMVEDKKHDRPTSSAKLQTILVQDCPSGEAALASLKQWKTAATTTVSVNGSITPVNGQGEDTGLISGKSYTRVIRVKEVGYAGESDWKYATHTYAAPYAATNVEGTVTKTEASLNCYMTWQTPTDAGHPIDKDGVIPEWAIAIPDTGMECPDEADFEELPAQSSTSGIEAKQFTIDKPIGADKCLFLRVVTIHDNDEVQSNAVLAKGDSVGPLVQPAFTEAPAITSTTVTIKASNESAVADSFVVDFLEREDGTVETLGLHDTSTKVYQVTNIENARVGIKAYVGTWNSTTKEVENILMESPMTWSAGNVPVAPSLSDFNVEQSIVPNTVLVSWDYSWSDADACEISWSIEPDAWISTEDPESYVVLKGLENKLAIKGVEPGIPLYVRIRYLDGVDEDAILSPYSDIKSITISTVPAIPTLNLEKQFFTQGEDITCSWIYVTTDGTEQAQAQIAERIVIEEGGETVISYDPLKDVTTEQKTVIENQWGVGTQHALAVKVANGSGNWSDWSEAVVITIAEPITCEITQASLETEEDGLELQELPMTVTVEGAGTGGQTALTIMRKGDYRIERPDGENFMGHDGEVVYQNIYTGEAQQTITLGDLQGDLDDGASYVIHAEIQDDYGQSDSDEIEFIVNWDHKAVKPSATVVVTDIAKITIAESEDVEEGDYVDIYRQSVDGTELIYTGAEFGETYVDPYPTIGEFGYLIVGRNAYGDFIMSESAGDYGQFAWTDLPAIFESEMTLIDFADAQIQLYYNVDVSHSWNKDFKKTKYLGGSIVGDYIAGVERTGSINAVSVPIMEPDMITAMRKLAEYEDNCHIRTKEGSSFTAAVQVSEEDNHDKAGFVRSFSMSIEKVEPVELDGMTEEEWEAQDAVEQGV